MSVLLKLLNNDFPLSPEPPKASIKINRLFTKEKKERVIKDGERGFDGAQKHQMTIAKFRSVMKGKRLTRKQINEKLGYKTCSALIARLKKEGLIEPCGTGKLSKSNLQKFKWIGK